MTTYETKIGIVIMEYDKQPRYLLRPFRVVVNKMATALNKRLQKGGTVTASELATLAAYTLLDNKTGADKR